MQIDYSLHSLECNYILIVLMVINTENTFNLEKYIHINIVIIK